MIGRRSPGRPQPRPTGCKAPTRRSISFVSLQFEYMPSSRCGPHFVRVLSAIDHHRSDAEAEQAPEPDALHRAFERDVERRVDEDRYRVAEDEQEQLDPSLVSTSARAENYIQ